MENTKQETAAAEEVTEVLPQETTEDKTDSIPDIWMKAANSYWDAFILRKTQKDELHNPYLPKFLTNGAATRSRNSWNTCISMCKSMTQAMIEPGTVNSYFKASEDMPENLLKMQRTEMDRFFKWHSDMLNKSANFEKLTQLMCIKTFM